MALSIAIMSAGPAFAQSAGSPAAVPVQQEATEVDEIVVTGSRFGNRTQTQSAVPVDTVSTEDLAQNGRVGLLESLKVEVPGFSTPQPIGAGTVAFLQSPTLRGLGPGEVLVLLDGKRRHTTSDLNFSVAIGRGDVAVDFNAIPALALSRIEVLRDGAAAQYGSDAISGVINQVLDRSTGFRGQSTYRTTTQGDGEMFEIGASAGLRVGAEGVLRLTAAFEDHQEVNRATPDTRQQYFGSNGTRAPSANFGSGVGLTPSNGTLDPREATIDRDVFQAGEPAYRNAQIFYNFVMPTGGSVELYFFGGYNRLDGESQQFFRRAGQDETIRALYPDGFRPVQKITLENTSAAVGVRGDGPAGFGFDLSTVYGIATNDVSFVNSNNASLGLDSPASFYRGGNRFYQWTTNLDLTRAFDLGDGAPLNVAFGVEYRREDWRLTEGEPASYLNGGVPVLDGPNAGRPAPIGAQPSQGNQPVDSAEAGRDSHAIYGELEKEMFERLLLSAAVRHESYSDFGDTTNYKVAGRFEVLSGAALRASFSTGFRAPALAQSNYSATNTLFLSGNPTIVRIAAVDSPIARLLGATDLKPEKSDNLSVGAVYRGGGLTASIDAYRIELKDRIAISSNFQDPRITAFLAAEGFAGFSAVSFITNAVDTTTEGVDLVASYRLPLGANVFTATLAGNWTKTEFDRIAGTPAPIAALGVSTALFDLTQQVRFSDSLPRDKITLDLNWTRGPWAASVTNTRYGQVASVALTGRTPAQVAALIPGYDVRLVPSPGSAANQDIVQRFAPRLVTDVEVSYQATPAVRLSLGSNNLFDVVPEKNIASTVASVAAGTNGSDNAGTLPFNNTAPFSFAGRYVFVRAGFTF